MNNVYKQFQYISYKIFLRIMNLFLTPIVLYIIFYPVTISANLYY